MNALLSSSAKEGSEQFSVHSNYAVQNAAAGLWHVTNVLAMMVDICMESATSHHATPAFQDYLAWLLDSFLVIHGLQKRCQGYPIFSETCNKSEAMALCAVQALLSTLRVSLPETILRKGCEFLSLLIADLLENSSSLSDVSIKYSICSGLLILATACKRHESTRRSLTLHLAPSIRIALSDDCKIPMLGKDFQVSIDNTPTTDWLTCSQKAAVTLCQACEPQSLESLDINAIGSFENTQLNGEFDQLGLGLDGSHSDNHPPPSKRRKLHSKLNLVDEITTNLCSLLGLENVTSLSELNQTIEYVGNILFFCVVF